MYRVAKKAYTIGKRAFSARKARVARKRVSFVGAQTDVKFHKLEGVGNSIHVFTGSNFATPIGWSPLETFYQSTMFTDHVLKMYQQWRLKSVTIKSGVDAITTSNGSIMGQTLTAGA